MFELVGRAHAQGFNIPGFTFLQTGSLAEFVTRIITWFLGFAGVIAIIFLVYGGILYITSGGDTAKADKGRVAIVNSIIGIAVIILAWIIVRWVTTLVLNNNPTA